MPRPQLSRGMKTERISKATALDLRASRLEAKGVARGVQKESKRE